MLNLLVFAFQNNHFVFGLLAADEYFDQISTYKSLKSPSGKIYNTYYHNIPSQKNK